MNRFMNDADLYEAVLTAFLSEDILERAEIAYAAKDNEKLMKTVHEAKGVGGDAGLDTLYTEASLLLKLLRNPPFTDEELTRDFDRF